MGQAGLDRYRVVEFATHGLMSGDLAGLAEPALVLTPPPLGTPDNDGLADSVKSHDTQTKCQVGRLIRMQHCGRRRHG
jgi:hypothetical protein